MYTYICQSQLLLESKHEKELLYTVNYTIYTFKNTVNLLYTLSADTPEMGTSTQCTLDRFGFPEVPLHKYDAIHTHVPGNMCAFFFYFQHTESAIKLVFVN